MNIALLAAAGIAVALGIAHSLLGERVILMRLFDRVDLTQLFRRPAFTRRTLRFGWHLATAAWLGFAGLLVLLAVPGGVAVRDAARVVSAVFAASGLLALAITRGRHLSWIGFFAVALLAWFAFPG
jgi:hypothetical protein